MGLSGVMMLEHGIWNRDKITRSIELGESDIISAST
jgi:hypothetical protein